MARAMNTIRNLVLDMGNVMLIYDPKLFIARMGITDPDDAKLLYETISRSREWPMMDSGELDEGSMAEIVLPRLPERLRKAGSDLIHHWMEPVIPVEGMAELVKKCKECGMKVYLLSNASRYQHVYWETVPGHELFDAAVISADIGIVKPDRRIYEYLLQTYGLKAEESIFVDDVEANAEGARKVGMDAFWFKGRTADLERYLFEEA